MGTTRMNKILEYDINNLAVRVQPGVLLQDLAADALEQGLMYPPDPGEKTSTLGGNVATNAGGMRAIKYGVTRDYVLAMTVVLPTGEIMELGKTVFKTSSGYSLLHLMIGSEGTLGIITELTLKLIPKPNFDMSFILPFPDIESCISAVPKIKLANPIRSLLSLWTKISSCPRQPSRATPCSPPNMKANLLKQAFWSP